MLRKQLVIEEARRILGSYDAAAEAVGPSCSRKCAVRSRHAGLESFGGGVLRTTGVVAGGLALSELTPLGRASVEQGQQDVRVGLEAMKKVERGRDDEISEQGQCGLEAIILLTGRPAILIQAGDFMEPPPLWADLKPLRSRFRR